MIPLTRHTVTLHDENGVPLPVDLVAVQVEMNAAWSPRLQGVVTVHAEDAAILERDQLTIRLRQTFGPDMSIAAISAWWRGSLAALTAQVGGYVGAVTQAHTRPWHRVERIQRLHAATNLWGGAAAAVTAAAFESLAAMTAALRQPGGQYLPPPPQVLEALVRVRPSTMSVTSKLATVAISSADIALHDARRLAATPLVSDATSMRVLVQQILDYVNGVLAPGPDIAINAGQTWEPGETHWDMLHRVTEAAGWQLYADTDGQYQLRPATATAAPFTLDRGLNLIEYTGRQSPLPDSAMVEYSLEDGTTSYIFDTSYGQSRTVHERRDGAAPGPDAAEHLLTRARQRASSADALALALYGLRPWQRIEIRADDTPATATVDSVSWAYPETRMRVTLSDITPHP